MSDLSEKESKVAIINIINMVTELKEIIIKEGKDTRLHQKNC